MHYISTTDIIKRAWQTVKANLFTFISAAVVLFIIQLIFTALTNTDQKEQVTLTLGFLDVATTLVSLVIGVAVTAALIRIARGAPVTTQALSITSSQVLRFVGVHLLVGLIMLALVIPVVGAAVVLGITTFTGEINNNVLAFVAILIAALMVIVYINIRLMFAKYIVLDGATGVFGAIKRSWNITSGRIWTIVKLGLISILVVSLGAIALLIGLLVAVPVVALAYAYLYVELSAQVVEVKN